MAEHISAQIFSYTISKLMMLQLFPTPVSMHTEASNNDLSPIKRGSCKPWNNITTNNKLSNYSIESSVQTGVSTRPL